MKLRHHLDPNSISVLKTPDEFYGKLNEICRNARHRIVISCLYISYGELQEKFVESICSACKTSPKISVDILMDFNRAQRKTDTKNGPKPAYTVLDPILECCKNVTLSLFYNTQLNYILYNILKSPNNEIFGTMHIKVYIGDDSIILTGANLNVDYFTSRQDRYYLIKDESFADILHTLIGSIQKISFTCLNGKVQWDSRFSHPWYQPMLFKLQVGHYLRETLDVCQNMIDEAVEVKGTCSVDMSCLMLDKSGILSKDSIYCVITLCINSQFTDPPITDDYDMIHKLIKDALETNHSLVVSSPYMNFTNEYNELFGQFVVNKREPMVKFVGSSPASNSFFKAPGTKGIIPNLYSVASSYCINKMLKLVRKDQSDDINDIANFYHEYARENWTFHAKGIWFYDCIKDLNVPCATVIGSSNYGLRSRYLDIEMSVCIQTNDFNLCLSMNDEVNSIFEYAKPVSLPELSSRYSLFTEILYKYVGVKYFL